MGGVALLARALGHRVTGSDTQVYPPMSTQLAEAGIQLQEGYLAAHLDPTPDQVVVGNALSRDNEAVEYLLDQYLVAAERIGLGALIALNKMDLLEPDGQVQFSETGRWLQKVCPGVGAVAVGGQFIIPEGGAVDVEALAEEALASVSIPGPAIRTSPELDRIYVRVPTWLWVDGSWWHGYQATASAGRVTATVTATPRSSSWTLGDGSTVRCDGPGIAWNPGLPEDVTSCAHTYTTSSAGRPGDKFSLSAAVQLDVSWTSNIGQGGTLPAISRTSTQPIVVGEIQAVGTSG